MSMVSLSDKSLGERVRLLRERLGLTQEAFAAPLGLKKSFISRVEKGDQSLSRPAIILMTYIYKINLEWIESGTGEMFQGEAAEVEGRPQPINADVLRQIIEGLEMGLEQKGKVLDPGKKAELIALLYEHFTDARKNVDSGVVERYLRLVG